MASTDAKETSKGGHKPVAFCVFQDTQGGTTVQTVAEELMEYGPAKARLLLLTDDPSLTQAIRTAQARGAKFFIQVKSEKGEGGDPLNNSRPCPGSVGCP